MKTPAAEVYKQDADGGKSVDNQPGGSDDGSSTELDEFSLWYTTGVPTTLLLKNLTQKTITSELINEFVRYVPFLIMFVFFFLGLPGTASSKNVTDEYYIVRVVKDRLVGNFYPGAHVEKYGTDASSAQDWTEWVETVAIPNLWDCGNDPDGTTQQPTLQGQNFLLGALRLRALRVAPDSCSVNEHVFSAAGLAETPGLRDCYGSWSTGDQVEGLRFGFPDPVKFPAWTDLVAPVARWRTVVRVSELHFAASQGGTPVTVPLERAEARNPYGLSGVGKGAPRAIDGNVFSDWEDYDAGSLVVAFASATSVDFFTFTTAGGSSESDPVRWTVHGAVNPSSLASDEGWTLLHEQGYDHKTPTARMHRLPWFALAPGNASNTFTHVRFTRPTPRGEAAGEYRVNWEPPPTPETGGFASGSGGSGGTRLQRGLVPGRADAVQFAELRLRAYDPETVVDRGPGFGGMAAAGAGMMGFEGGEYPISGLIDGDPETKWVGGIGGSLLNATFTVVLPDMVRLSAMSFLTADDQPWRDPVGWRIEGTNRPEDAASWRPFFETDAPFATPLRRRAQTAWLPLNAAGGGAPTVFSHYRFTFTAVRGGVAEADLMYNFRECGGATADALHGFTMGDMATYHCGGHLAVIPFNSSCATALSVARSLRSVNYPFVDNFATRFVALEFFLYTPQFDVFLSSKYYAEIAACGSWTMRWAVRTFSVWSSRHVLQMIYDCFFFCFVGYFITRFVANWKRHVRKNPWYTYLVSVWNLLELGNLVAFACVFVLRVVWWTASANMAKKLPFPAEYPEEISHVSNVYQAQRYATAVNIVVNFLKFLKFIRLNERLNLLTRTLAASKEQLIACLLIFVYIVFAFALAGNSLFGVAVFDYRTIGASYSSLSRMLLGDFDYDELKQENDFLAGAFFWAYLVLALFLMLNFLIAILTNNFAALSASSGETQPFDEAVQRMWYKLKRVLSPKRIVRDARLVVTGHTRADILDAAVRNTEEYWTLLRTCSDCGHLSSCVCTFDSGKGACGRCGATGMCSISGTSHNTYLTDPASSQVYRSELRSIVGSAEYDLLGKEYFDDVWQEVLWDWERKKGMRANTAAM
eukprot:gene4252-6568_t